MLAYYAFKALRGRYPDALCSVQKCTPWALDPSLALPYLIAGKGKLDRGHGVYAAAIDEAQAYASAYDGDVYLVAPLPGKQVVVGERGWRAEGAICLGPVTQDNEAQTASLIIHSAKHGLPQVPAVLRWAEAISALSEGKPANLVIEELLRSDDGGREMVKLELLLPHIHGRDKQRVAQHLIAICEGGSKLSGHMLRWAVLVASESAGKLVQPKTMRFQDLISRGKLDSRSYALWVLRLLPYFSDEHFSLLCETLLSQGDLTALVSIRRSWLEHAVAAEIPDGEMDHRTAWGILALAKALGTSGCPQDVLRAAFDFAMQRNDLGWVCQLGAYCDDERWAKQIFDVIMSNRGLGLLYLAGRDWSPACYRKDILETLLASAEPYHLYLAGRDWSDERFDPAIAEALAKTGDAYCLYVAGADWPVGRCHAVIARALAQACRDDPRYLYLAGKNWPDAHFDTAIIKGLAATNDPRYLYFAGLFWPDGRYDEAIARALIETKDAEYICLAGEDWPSGRFSEDIARGLVEAGNAYMLYLAGLDWPQGRGAGIILEGLCALRAADCLYLAGRDWPDERFGPTIAEVLAETGNAMYLYLAGKDWPDGRFCDRIAQALVGTGDPEYLYLAGRDWPDGRYTDAICRALIAIGDPHWMHCASRTWPAGRFLYVQQNVFVN